MSATLPGLLILAGLLGSDIKRDESVLFFETWAWHDQENRQWVVPIHGWIFEPERDSITRKALLDAVSDILDVDESAHRDAEAILRERGRWFIVDNERGKRISVRLAGDVYDLPPSEPNGHFQAVLRVPDRSLNRLTTRPAAGADWLRFEAVLPPGDERAFTGAALLAAPTGLSVVSDIDDTIRVSRVSDPEAAVEKALLQPFEAVNGMSDVYQQWEKAGASFHWISESPWQFYVPLREFMAQQGFPNGTFALKPFRLKDTSLLNLFDDPVESKPAKIEPLLKRFPRRRFIFVGDSGQKDPEIYGDLARRYPDQVVGVFIREVTDQSADAVRYEAAFRGIPQSAWQVFREAEEIGQAARRLVAAYGRLREDRSLPEEPRSMPGDTRPSP